jgi:hypothetical protein
LPTLTFFCELDAAELTELFADGAVAARLADLGARVSMGLRDLSAERAAVVRRLTAAGVPVIAWQLLPDEQGYWYNLANPHHAAARYAEFQRWTRAHGLRWAGVGIDIEPDIREVARWFASPLRLTPALLRRARDRGRLRRATEQYRALIAQMRADGYSVESYIIPLIYDERRAGSTLLRRLAGLVDLPADREVPMLYSSFHRPYGAGMVASYVGAVGPAAGLGSTGGGVDVGGIDRIAPLSWAELSRDLRLAARHCHELYVFSLEGCARQGLLDRLADFDWGAPHELTISHTRRVAQVRAALGALLWLSARPHAWLALLYIFCCAAWLRHAAQQK